MFYRMNSYLGLFVLFVSLCGLIFKTYRAGSRMRLTLVLYLGILVVDLLVGGCMVVWNCVVRDDAEECSLAVGGALGSVVILSIVMLLCPLYMTKWSLCEIADSIKEVIKRKLKHLKSQHKEHQLLVESQQLLLIKSKKSNRFTSLDENKNDVIMPDSNISIVPSGRGPVRGVEKAKNFSKTSRSEVKVKYTEVNET